MAILHVITGLEVGGAETVLGRLAVAMHRDGEPAMVVAVRGGGAVEGSIRSAGIPVVCLWRSGSRAGTVTGFWPVVSACRKFAPTVIVGWMYHGILLAELLGRFALRSAPVVWNIRCTIDDSPNWPRTTQALIAMLGRGSRRARKVVYNSDAGRAQHEQAGYAREVATVIDNGVDTGLFRPDALARTQLRAELGIAPDALVVGHVARYHPMKAHAHFLQALAGRDFRRDVCIVMAGTGVDEHNAALARQIHELGSCCRVLLLGERPDVHRLMNAFDVFCLTSTGGEGFPNVVVEAMAVGVPCVVTSVGDAARIVGDTGVVVPPCDIAALGNALVRAVEESDAQRRANGQAARARAVEMFSFDRMVGAYRQLIASVADHE